MMQEFLELLTPAGFAVLLNILVIDVVMSGDNAILIWMATKWLKWSERKKAIFFWIFFATILRIGFSFFAVYMLWVFWLKLAGGLLLLYVVWKFYKEIRLSGEWVHTLKNATTLMWAIYLIVIADVSMSLDNVLAVAWASHWNIVALGIWLVLSIALMGFASNLIAKYLNDYQQIQWVWLFAILVVAMGMIYEWSLDISWNITHFNILPFIVFVVWSLFVVLQQKYIPPLTENKIQKWLSENYMYVISTFLLLLVILMVLWDTVKAFLFSHIAVFYSVLFMMLFLILEMFSLIREQKRPKTLKEKIFGK